MAGGETEAAGELRERLLASVEHIRPILAAQCEMEEQQAYLSRASSDALYNAGILQMKVPEVLGGGEADLVTQYEVIEAVSRINPAAGWCSMVGATSIALPGAFLSDEGVARMFGGGQRLNASFEHNCEKLLTQSIIRRRRGLISAIGNSCLMRWFSKPTLSDRRPQRQPVPVGALDLASRACDERPGEQSGSK